MTAKNILILIKEFIGQDPKVDIASREAVRTY
jgi:hypothetical protein